MAFTDTFPVRRPFGLVSCFLFCTALALSFSSCQEKTPGSVPEKPASTESNAPATTVNPENAETASKPQGTENAEKSGTKTEVATFGGGCFWCTEAVMERLVGVTDVKSGYMGGHVENPTYEQVCQKDTGHIEVIQVTYDPSQITFDDLLDVFWQAHDPTTKDQQGADKGPQYRSVIFTHSAEQKEKAQKSMKALDKSGKYPKPAVTEIRDAMTFWEAEDYHQDFYKNNPNYGYCRVVISPKLKKLNLE